MSNISSKGILLVLPPCSELLSQEIHYEPSIIRPVPSQPESQAKLQNDSPFMKKDKEPIYQLPDPTIGASSRPPDMNMLTVDPDPPNPISSFLKTLTLNDSREPFVLPVIEDSDPDLSDLGLEEVFITNNEPKVEEEDDVLRPEKPPSPPPPIFPPPPFIPDHQTLDFQVHFQMAKSSPLDSNC